MSDALFYTLAGGAMLIMFLIVAFYDPGKKKNHDPKSH